MWKVLLKVVLAVSSNPAVRDWVQRKATAVADKLLHKASQKASDLHGVAEQAAVQPPVNK